MEFSHTISNGWQACNVCLRVAMECNCSILGQFCPFDMEFADNKEKEVKLKMQGREVLAVLSLCYPTGLEGVVLCRGDGLRTATDHHFVVDIPLIAALQSYALPTVIQNANCFAYGHVIPKHDYLFIKLFYIAVVFYLRDCVHSPPISLDEYEGPIWFYDDLLRVMPVRS